MKRAHDATARAKPRRPGDEPSEEARRLLEEAWNVYAQCLVMRDGLLEACEAIEQAMREAQQRLAALALPAESQVQHLSAAPRLSVVERQAPPRASSAGGAAGG